MSKSPSLTPTPPNTTPVNLSSTVSRRQPRHITTNTSPHESETRQSPPLNEGEREYDEQHASTHLIESSPSSYPPQPSYTTSQRRRRTHSPPSDQPMAKRIRRPSASGPESSSARSSPSGDSQGAMADTEGRSQRSPHSPPPATAPPKKKRTRTLTTPHQSAVLHALLAQSRFPTTAMREEVGRAIGLSARKVQIWFQNQRQKARRPRSQGEAPLARPPQYGPFPPAPAPGGMSHPYAEHPHREAEPILYARGRYEGFEDDPFPRDGSSSSEQYRSSDPSSSTLLGPGMPGWETRHRHAYRGGPASPHSPAPVPGPSSLAPRTHRTQPYLRRSPSPPTLRGLHAPPSMGHPLPGATSPIERDLASRTLPPLTFGGLTPSARGPLSPLTAISGHIPSHSAPAGSSSFEGPGYHRSISPESPFAHRPPELNLQGRPASLGNIPPPFALEPRPMWDRSLFTSENLPASFSRPGTSTTYSSTSPISPLRSNAPFEERRGRGRGSSSGSSRRDRDWEDTAPSSSTSSRFELSSGRSGRFDPVRSSLPHPYTSSSPPTTPRSDEDRND